MVFTPTLGKPVTPDSSGGFVPTLGKKVTKPSSTGGVFSTLGEQNRPQSWAVGLKAGFDTPSNNPVVGALKGVNDSAHSVQDAGRLGLWLGNKLHDFKLKDLLGPLGSMIPDEHTLGDLAQGGLKPLFDKMTPEQKKKLHDSYVQSQKDLQQMVKTPEQKLETPAEKIGYVAEKIAEIAPGAIELGANALKAGTKALGPFSKWAKAWSTLPEEAVNAVHNPAVAEDIAKLRAGTLPEPVLPEVPNIPKPVKPVPVSVPEPGPVPGSPEELKTVGQDAYNTAQAQRKVAGEAYGTGRKALIDANEGKVIQRSKDFVTGTDEALKGEGISVVKNKKGKMVVDVTGSQFEGSPSAETTLQRVRDIMTRPVVKQSGKSVADDLLTRREALSTVMNEIPSDQANLRRVVGNMRDSFDTTLDNVLGSEASNLRSSYAESMKAANPVINEMTKIENGKQVFSEDKAFSFIDKTLKDSKFDNTRMLEELDAVAGSSHAKDAQNIADARTAYEAEIEASKKAVAEINAKAKDAFKVASDERAKQIIEAKRIRDVAKTEADAKLAGLKQLQKALSQSSPAVTDGRWSVIRRYMTNLPIVGNKLTPFFTPKMWGDWALSQGLSKSSIPMTLADAPPSFKTWLLANVLISSFHSKEAPGK